MLYSIIFSIFKRVDTFLGELIIGAYVDAQRVQYRVPKLEKNNNRLSPKKGGR